MGPRHFSRGSGEIVCLLNQETIELQWGHGISAVEVMERLRKEDRYTDSFNGATAFQPWKSRAT